MKVYIRNNWVDPPKVAASLKKRFDSVGISSSSHKTPLFYGVTGWKHLVTLEGYLNKSALKKVKIQTILTIIFSLGLALCFTQIRENLKTLKTKWQKVVVLFSSSGNEKFARLQFFKVFVPNIDYGHSEYLGRKLRLS